MREVKRTNNYWENVTQESKDWAIRTRN